MSPVVNNVNTTKPSSPLNIENTAVYVPTHLRNSYKNNDSNVSLPPVQVSKYNFNNSHNVPVNYADNSNNYITNNNYGFCANSNKSNNNQKPNKKGCINSNNNNFRGNYTGEKSIYG